MPVLRIEHSVSNFDTWKKLFDKDPLERRQSGVRRYRLLRSLDDPNYVMIDLEFDNANDAEAVLAAVRALWLRTDELREPRARLAEVVESREY